MNKEFVAQIYSKEQVEDSSAAYIYTESTAF